MESNNCTRGIVAVLNLVVAVCSVRPLSAPSSWDLGHRLQQSGVSMFNNHLPKLPWMYLPGHAKVKGND